MIARDVMFITHADVLIDPDIPVPEWPLNDRGRSRHLKHATALARGPAPAAIWSSDETKARDAAAILGSATGVAPRVEPLLRENDRSSTGFLPPDEFERTAIAFFAHPDQSIRGWETARDAQKKDRGRGPRMPREHRPEWTCLDRGTWRGWCVALGRCDRRDDQPTS